MRIFNRTETMNFEHIPTPETDYAIVDTRGYERILPDFARDLERRLTVAREALAEIYHSCMTMEQADKIAEKVHHITAPKP